MAWRPAQITWVCTALLVSGPALPVAQQRVDMELVLAVDSSASVDQAEFALQIHGIAHAFRTPEVQQAVADGPYRAIGVTVMEWSSADWQAVNIPWTVIDGPDSARRMAERVESMPRTVETGATSISGALLFAMGLFDAGNLEGIRRVIDLSCDGRNNQGTDVDLARDIVTLRGITINGLTILNEHPTLDYYFRNNIIGGNGAFVEIANNYDAYADAITRKLVREIRNVPVAFADPALTGATPSQHGAP